MQNIDAHSKETRKIAPLTLLFILGSLLACLYFLVIFLVPRFTVYLPTPTNPSVLAPAQLLDPALWQAYASELPAAYALLLALTFLAIACLYLFIVARLYRLSKTVSFSKLWLLLPLSGAVVFGGILLFLPVFLSPDVLAYISVSQGHTTSYQYLLSYATPYNSAPYGPLWLAPLSLFATISSQNPALLPVIFRVAGLVIHLVNTLLIWHMLGKLAPERRLAGTLLYAWNPLVLLELAGNGHIDMLVICLLLLAVALYLQQKGPRTEISAIILLGIAASLNMLVFLLVPPFLWFIERKERKLSSAAWGFCWRFVVLLAVVALFYLPVWQGSSTYLALISSFDMNHFQHSPLGSLVIPLRWLYTTLTSGLPYPPSLLNPIFAADATILSTSIFLFILLYFRVLGRVRDTSFSLFPALDTLFACLSIVLVGFTLLAASDFWPWYMLWLPCFAALRRFDRLSICLLLLSCATLLYYPFLYLDGTAIAVFLPLCIFATPVVYILVQRLRASGKLERKNQFS
jgi:hypothetical protein